MNLFTEIFKRWTNSKPFVYHNHPYQNETDLVENLTTGILFETNNLFIPWMTRYDKLKSYNCQISERGDRTIYNFGVHKILNGLELDLSSMKWHTTSSRSAFGSVEANLGQDEIGRTVALKVKDHIVKTLGEPNHKNRVEDREMSVQWIFGKTRISLVGWTHFAVKYYIKVEPNWSFLKD